MRENSPLNLVKYENNLKEFLASFCYGNKKWINLYKKWKLIILNFLKGWCKWEVKTKWIIPHLSTSCVDYTDPVLPTGASSTTGNSSRLETYTPKEKENNTNWWTYGYVYTIKTCYTLYLLGYSGFLHHYRTEQV